MNGTKLREWIYVLCLIGVAQFLILTVVGMFYYPGGTLHDAGTEGYSFFRNYLSDLGRTTAHNGVQNSFNAALYQFTLSFNAVETMVFFVTSATVFSSVFGGLLRWLMAGLGVYAGWQYFGIAANPVDVNYFGHIYAVRNGFIAFLLALFLMGILFEMEEKAPRWPAKVIFGYTLLMAIQIGIMLFGPRARSGPNAELLQVSAQKIVVYSQLIVMGLVIWAMMTVNRLKSSQ